MNSYSVAKLRKGKMAKKLICKEADLFCLFAFYPSVKSAELLL
jgi:hypothetical protein